MSARSGLVGKNPPGPIWGHLRPIFPWTGKIQKNIIFLRIFAYFPGVGPLLLSTRGGGIGISIQPLNLSLFPPYPHMFKMYVWTVWKREPLSYAIFPRAPRLFGSQTAALALRRPKKSGSSGEDCITQRSPRSSGMPSQRVKIRKTP